MLDPWIIEQIRRREEERRRGERPQLEMPLPDIPWPAPNDAGDAHADKAESDRGVAIIPI